MSLKLKHPIHCIVLVNTFKFYYNIFEPNSTCYPNKIHTLTFQILQSPNSEAKWKQCIEKHCHLLLVPYSWRWRCFPVSLKLKHLRDPSGQKNYLPLFEKRNGIRGGLLLKKILKPRKTFDFLRDVFIPCFELRIFAVAFVVREWGLGKLEFLCLNTWCVY